MSTRLRRRGRARPEQRGGWRHVPALLICLLFVLPLVYMVTGSLRKAGLPPPRTPEFVPSPLAFDNYGRAFDLVDIPRYTLNSLIVAAVADLRGRIGGLPRPEPEAGQFEGVPGHHPGDPAGPNISTWPEIEDAVEGPLQNGLYLGDTAADVASQMIEATTDIFAAP